MVLELSENQKSKITARIEQLEIELIPLKTFDQWQRLDIYDEIVFLQQLLNNGVIETNDIIL
jgi:hypothetical protein